MTTALPRPHASFATLRRLAARLAPTRKSRARDPLDEALRAELQSMRHGAQMLRLRDLRAHPRLARDIGLEPDVDPCPPLVGPGGRLF